MCDAATVTPPDRTRYAFSPLRLLAIPCPDKRWFLAIEHDARGQIWKAERILGNPLPRFELQLFCLVQEARWKHEEECPICRKAGR
jgi:hypothetical protein